MPVGRHTGERADASSSGERPPRRRVLLLSLFVTVTLVAWGVLVFAAIDLGREARSGESTAWTFLILAAVGAAACLFVTMILGGRLLAVMRGRELTPPRSPRVPGRRASR
jgi:fatty acid desaturase